VNRSVAGVILALIAALAAIGVATGEEESDGGTEGPSGPSVAQIARRVERVRELRFERPPRVRRVSAAEARRAGLAELDRSVTPADLAAEERLLKLLGLLPPEARMRELFGKVLGGEVGGYYVPGTDTLNLVRGGGLGGLFSDVVVAHELTHALEDQRFGLRAEEMLGFARDRAVAETALHEGTATVVMIDYLLLTRAGTDDAPAGLRARVLEEIEGVALPASSDLPRYMREGLIFPYAAGAVLVDRIESRGGWGAVDRAYGPDAPLSTEQVMHPEKYDARERPVRVRLRGYREALPRGASLAYEGDLGEFDTEQFLRSANGRDRSERAAAGWGGGSFALWRLPDGGDALVMGWRWDSRRDATEFLAAAMRQLAELDLPGAIRGGKRSATIVLAPTANLAQRLSRGQTP
jgi:hypothetical protein